MKHMATDVFGPQHGGEAHQSVLAVSSRLRLLRLRWLVEMAEDTQSKGTRGLTVADIVRN